MSRAATTVAHKALPIKARRYPAIRGGESRAAETLDLFRPDEPHPSSLLSAKAAYKTTWGATYEGDGATLLAALPDQSVDLVVTSPPYALHFKKEYGNVDKDGYVEWLRPFGREIEAAGRPPALRPAPERDPEHAARRRPRA